jgi:GH15 family glucan-1,4-alpha-glucosidase
MLLDSTFPPPSLNNDWLYETSLKIILANQAETGAFVASPNFGQYRYCWFRDGAFIALALSETGRPETIEASRRFHQWANNTIQRHRPTAQAAIAKVRAGQPLNRVTDVLHCRYTLNGEPSKEEWGPFQIDGFGTWLFALADYARRLDPTQAAFEIEGYSDSIQLLVEYLGALWLTPNYDCWEEHGDQLATSTLAALYGGLSRVGEMALLDPDDRLLAEAGRTASGLAAQIKNYLWQYGTTTDPATGERYLTKFCGGTAAGDLAGAVDANLLWVAVPYGLWPVADPLVQATLRGIISELVTTGQPDGHSGVHRYVLDSYFGGGEWLLLTAWLGAVLVESGQTEGAKALLGWIEKQARPDGALPEQTFQHLNQPAKLAYWTARWGEVATPLIWSHASYVTLVNRLKVVTKP